MSNLKIIAPGKIIIGFNTRPNGYYDQNGEYHNDGNYQLGFATFMDGKILRKEKSWNQWRDKKIPQQEFDNVPIEGFKLRTVSQRSRDWFGTGRNVWQIEDPRGFVLEITSENMNALMHECDILKGEIKVACIWAWSGANMSLIPVSSELYKNVLDNTKRVNTVADKSQLQIGNKVTLKDGTVGIYYGKYHALMRQYDEIKSSTVEIVKLESKKGKSYQSGTMWYITSEVKLSSINETEIISKEVAFNELSEICKKIRKKKDRAFEYDALKAEENLETISNYKVFHLSLEPIKLMDFYVEKDLTEEDINTIANFNFLRNNGDNIGDFWKYAKRITNLRRGNELYHVSRHEGYTLKPGEDDKYAQRVGRILFHCYQLSGTEKVMKIKQDSYSNGKYMESNIYRHEDAPTYSYADRRWSEYHNENSLKEKIKKGNFKKVYLEIENDIVNL